MFQSKEPPEQIWTEDHLMKNPQSIHLSYLWVDKCRWKEINRSFFGRNELLYAYKHCSCERSQCMYKEAFVSPFSSISTVFTLHLWNFRWYLLVIWCTLSTDFWYLSMNNHSFVCIMYSHVLRRNTQHWTYISFLLSCHKRKSHAGDEFPLYVSSIEQLLVWAWLYRPMFKFFCTIRFFSKNFSSYPQSDRYSWSEHKDLPVVECTKQCVRTASSLPLFQLFQYSRLTKLLLSKKNSWICCTGRVGKREGANSIVLYIWQDVFQPPVGPENTDLGQQMTLCQEIICHAEITRTDT